MNRYIKVIYVLICMLLILTGCAFSTRMVNEKGEEYTCMAPGIGPLSGLAAYSYSCAFSSLVGLKKASNCISWPSSNPIIIDCTYEFGFPIVISFLICV